MTVYDASTNSFENLKTWLESFHRENPEALLVVVGTKTDLADERKLNTEEAKAFAESKSAAYCEISAKTDREGVMKVRQGLL